MKYLFLFLTISGLLLSCSNDRSSASTILLTTDSTNLGENRIIHDYSLPLKRIGFYEVHSGFLSVYIFNNKDTIYIMEGKTSSYPVSLIVK